MYLITAATSEKRFQKKSFKVLFCQLLTRNDMVFAFEFSYGFGFFCY